MTQNKSNHDLESAIRAMRNDEPTAEQLRVSGVKVWQQLDGAATGVSPQPEVIRGCEDVVCLLPEYAAGRLSTARALVVEAHLRDCVACRRQAAGREASTASRWTVAIPEAQRSPWPRFALLAAVILLSVSAFFVHNMYLAVPAGARASVHSLDGVAYRVTSEGDRLVKVGDQLSEGDILRTASGAHAFVRLSDGSMVEMNERSDFAVTARGKDMTVALNRGAILVQAAKRGSGHLYIKTPDCRVAVTGTVFSVNSGIKGSRVSVVEGTVDVTHGGDEDVLHAGDQVATGENMAPLPVSEDIAWSRELPKHLELLAQFTKLQRKLEQVQLPAPRYDSSLLGRMPANAVVYVSIPNAGQALEDANRILQDQIQQSAALREWWMQGGPDAQQKFNETIAKIRQLSDYLGEEVVVVGFGGTERGSMAVVANVRRAGLREFLQTQFAGTNEHEKLKVTGPGDLASLPAQSQGPVALVRENEVVFSNSREGLQRVNAQFDSGTPGLENTEFGQRLAEAYQRGAGFLFGADLHQLMTSRPARRTRRASTVDRSGLGDMRYLIAEHRELNGIPDNRMVLDFAGERRGVASWLAAPSTMGSLDFVSRNAAVAVAFVAKDPQAIMTDIFNMSGRNREKTEREMAEAEQRLHLRIREDIAAHFGGDGVVALDGPVLPTSSWKLVIEVHDATALATSLEKLVQGINEELRSKGKAGAELQSEDVNGQRYYSVRSIEKNADTMHYTFAAGYMIVAPSRAILMNSLRTRSTGDSLARSGEFKALLPKDENANYSVIAYQNLAPIVQPLMAQLTGEQAKLVQELAADSRPSVICAWGRQSRIEAVSNSRLLGFDWLAIGSLLGRGTTPRQTP